MADNNTIARPYAQAAFDVARESGELDGWASALETAKSVMADGQVAKFLGNPTLNDGQRMQFLTGLLEAAGDSTMLTGGNSKGTNFVKLLLEYGRVDALPEICEHFEALKAQVENSVDVTVTSASPISDEQRARIASALRSKLGREVRIETEINENLIGGAVIRAGDVVIDGSLRARLEGLANALSK